MKPFGFTDAAKKITRKLKNAGAEIIAKPKNFYVTGPEGPLRAGALETAEDWSMELIKYMNK